MRRARAVEQGLAVRFPAGRTSWLWARHRPREFVARVSCLSVEIVCHAVALLAAVACLLGLCAVAAAPATALRPSRLVRRALRSPLPFSSSLRPGCWHPYVYGTPNSCTAMGCDGGGSVVALNVLCVCACSVIPSSLLVKASVLVLVHTLVAYCLFVCLPWTLGTDVVRACQRGLLMLDRAPHPVLYLFLLVVVSADLAAFHPGALPSPLLAARAPHGGGALSLCGGHCLHRIPEAQRSVVDSGVRGWAPPCWSGV